MSRIFRLALEVIHKIVFFWGGEGLYRFKDISKKGKIFGLLISHSPLYQRFQVFLYPDFILENKGRKVVVKITSSLDSYKSIHNSKSTILTNWDEYFKFNRISKTKLNPLISIKG